uniref:hypothetical protein n=1 Tax=Nonomuraea sp. CA-251285 TaxID=3240002 RepID=UPI003F4959A4
MSSKRVSEQLWERLRAMGLAEHCGAGLRPLRPSRAARNAGAWSWASVDADSVPLDLGSQWPMAALLAAPRLVASCYSATDSDINIDPTEVEDDRPAGEWTFTQQGTVLLEHT